jgi:hypothetical protein
MWFRRLRAVVLLVNKESKHQHQHPASNLQNTAISGPYKKVNQVDTKTAWKRGMKNIVQRHPCIPWW